MKCARHRVTFGPVNSIGDLRPALLCLWQMLAKAPEVTNRGRTVITRVRSLSRSSGNLALVVYRMSRCRHFAKDFARSFARSLAWRRSAACGDGDLKNHLEVLSGWNSDHDLTRSRTNDSSGKPSSQISSKWGELPRTGRNDSIRSASNQTEKATESRDNY